MTKAIPDLLSGTALLGRGLGMILRRRKLFLLGAIAPLITSLIFVAVLVLLLVEADQFAAWVTPFSADWSPGAAKGLHALVGLAIAGAAILLMVISFSTLTLALGSPLYDKIAESVEAELGDVPDPVTEKLHITMVRAIGQSLVLIAVSLLIAALLFVCGFIPVIGQTVVPVVAAVFGGWMIMIEMVGSAFDRRGLFGLGQRRAAMRHRRMKVLGLGIPAFLLLSVPFLSIVVFPIATAAGTILARELVPATPAEPTQRAADQTRDSLAG